MLTELYETNRTDGASNEVWLLMAASALTLDNETVDGRSRELKNHVFVALAVIANTLGNFLLSVGMRTMDFKPCAAPLQGIRIFANRWVDAGVVLLLVWLAS